MQWNSKKMLASAAASLVSVTSLLSADMDNAQVRNLENRVTALEQKRGASGMINPPARPEVKNGVDLFVHGDWLIWQAHEDGLPVGIKNKELTGTIAKGKTKNIDFDWDFGFRVGIGYNTPHDGWDLDLTWLRFYTEGHSSTHAHANEEILATRIHPDFGLDRFQKAKGHWHARLNQIDLDLGREFYVSKWLTVRPHFGLRTTWLRQKFNINYDHYTFDPTIDVDVRNKNHWWGLGPEAGLDTQWGLGSGFSLYGNLAASIEYGFHKVRVKNHPLPPLNVKDSHRNSRAILDLQIGLQWDHLFYNDRYHIGLHGGWEQHVYFNQNQFDVFVDDLNEGTFVSNQGDLTYQGWTLGAQFDF